MEEEAERQLARERARERVLEEFERTQSGMGSSSKAAASSVKDVRNANANVEITSSTSTIGVSADDRGKKRKFALDDEEIAKLASEHEEKAMQQLEKERAEKMKAKLPNFWLPSLTPEAAPSKLSDVKLQSLCHAGTPAHPIRSARALFASI